MVNAAALSSIAALAAPAQEPQRAARGFSFDDAVASARRNAARALDIHGGAPTQTVTHGQAGAKAAEATATAGEQAADAAAPPAARAAPEKTATSQSPPKAAVAPAPAVAVAAPLAAPGNASAAAPPAPGQGQTATAPAGAVREAGARLKAEAPRALLPARAPSQAVTQFAEIIARRLDGASQFDIRLDPPALGGIEGRLTLSDDGDALLTLAFDNPSAFDLFRRDEAAIRAVLAQAGFDLSHQNLQMNFRAPTREEGDRRNDRVIVASDFTPAPLHRGAVDIRA